MMNTFRAFPVLAGLLAAAFLAAGPAAAQQRIGYVDSELILERVTEYRTAQNSLDRLAQQWQTEIQALQRELDGMERDFAAREILFTEEERQRNRQAIDAKAQEVETLRLRYFGPEGELFREQQRLMRPIQERVLEAIEAVAEDGNYDFVFDKAGDYLFLYVKPQHDLSELVLEELGIDPLAGGR